MSKEPNLLGLPGTKDGVYAETVKSITAAMRHVQAGRPVTAAGDRGALTVWRNDAGQLCCEFYRFKQTVNSTKAKTLVQARDWLKEWFEQMH